MISGQPNPVLPTPTRSRWQPLRMGLVELFHYEVEEFWFRDGHLMLRGNNGTGKSKVLSLTLPFLLDANLSSSRVEPDGERSKRMEWNLLMNGRHERRTGYSWIEFGRLDQSGEPITLTLGCQLRAIAGRSGVDSCYFITNQRVGLDIWLTTTDRTVISKERLIDAIGAQGQVFPTAQSYRRAVDERLFRLGTERYDGLVDTLIQLRQPQLSKSPDEWRLSEALTHALPPLNRAALEDVADAMSELDDIRRSLEEIEAMRKAISSFAARYRHYAKVAARRKSRSLRQAQTDFDNASREVNAAESILNNARTSVTECQIAHKQAEEALAVDTARLGVLRAHPVMRDAARLSDARDKVRECESLSSDSRAREKQAASQVDEESASAQRRRATAQATRSQLSAAASNACAFAAESGLANDHTQALIGIDLPDGVSTVTSEWTAVFVQRGREAEARRREHIAVVRKRLRAVESCSAVHNAARDARALRAEAFDDTSASVLRAEVELRLAGLAFVGTWREYANSTRHLRIANLEEMLESLGLWQQSLHGQNPILPALEQLWLSFEQRFAAKVAELSSQRRTLLDEQCDLSAQQLRLEAGQYESPPTPHTRDPALRKRLSGAPLWQLIDFAANVPAEVRAGLEAALEGSGLLDAWVLPDGSVIDPRTNDVVLIARRAVDEALTRYIQAAIPTDGVGADISSATINKILDSIACADREPTEAEMWVTTTGQFRVASARGAWVKPKAQYIGHSARETARKNRLEQVLARLSDIDRDLAQCLASEKAARNLRDQAQLEYEQRPSSDALLRAHASSNALEKQRRDAQVRLSEADAKLATAANALSKAREDLDADSRDLNVPKDDSELDRLGQSLYEYRGALSQLGNDIHQHQNALFEAQLQITRERNAIEIFEAAKRDQAERKRLLLMAIEAANTLQATVGKQVDELLHSIEHTETLHRKHDRDYKDAQAALVVAGSKHGMAQATLTALNQTLEIRIQARRDATEELQAFATQTGFIAIAVPEHGDNLETATWGIEYALTLARRTEAALANIPAEDTDWGRISREIGNDFTQLQSAMSTQGHSATAEPSDHALIVRIMYQQRHERPDALELRLDAELAEQKLILSVQERSLLEEHLEKEVSANLQRMISDTEERVAAINAELFKRPTSTGMRYRLRWQPLPESAENAVAGLSVARKRLLNTSVDAWSAEDRRQVGEFLRTRIDAERQKEERGTLFETLARALDYRQWHSFSVERNQDGAWRPLSGPASSGERALGLTVPLFAAASSHYESSDPRAPRLVLLDEAFAGIDDEARAGCMALIREFDLDFVMTSEREWGCYAELPGLSICQLVRRDGMDAVFVSRWTWDGRERRGEDFEPPRYPG